MAAIEEYIFLAELIIFDINYEEKYILYLAITVENNKTQGQRKIYPIFYWVQFDDFQQKINKLYEKPSTVASIHI